MNGKNIVSVTGEKFIDMPVADTSLALEVTDIDDDFNAVKAKLVKLYGDVEATADGKAVTLGALEKARTVVVPAQPDFAKKRYNAADALRVTTRLTRDDGCPWDRAQTHESIRVNMIEEAYEAVDAIDHGDVENMREEFGDVFLQSILQSDIAKRAGEFDFDDVCDELCKKLIGRHTFIFGGDSAGNPDEALYYWEKAKATEKHYDDVKSQLERLPDEFPSLLRAQKAYKKRKKIKPLDPKSELDAALGKKDYAAAIYALCGLLHEEGKDAEVELNKLVRELVSKL